MNFVLDASVTLTWALAGEIHAATVRALVLRVADEAAIVPALWPLVGNGLLMGEGRGRIRPEQVDAVWRQLGQLPIKIDAETHTRASSRTTAVLVRRHGLTLYKAAYLELAARPSLPLATFDGQFARAAATKKVSLAMDTLP